MALFDKKTKKKKYGSYMIVTQRHPESAAAEAYRRVKTAVEYSNVDTPVKVIQICSAMQGDGKTVVALNLATAFAEEKKVLLVDLDLRRPKVHRAFRATNENGIVSLASGKVSVEKAVHSVKYGLDFINAGEKPAYPASFIGSKSMQELFDYFRSVYDVIIVDGPPVLAVSDAFVISKLTDGCVYVVSQSNSEKAATKEGVDALRMQGVNILGCVYNSAKEKSKGYYKNNYYSGYSE